MFLISLCIHIFYVFALCLVYVLDNRDRLLTHNSIISLCIMCVAGLLSMPITGLTGFHVILVSRGRTTNEQVTGKFRGGWNPFDRGCLRNCAFTLCGPHWPRLIHRLPAKRAGENNFSKRPLLYTVTDVDEKVYIKANNGISYNHKQLEVSASLLTSSSSPGFIKKTTPSGSYTNLFEPREEDEEEVKGLLLDKNVLKELQPTSRLPLAATGNGDGHQKITPRYPMTDKKSATLPHAPKPRSLTGLAPLASFDDMTPSPTSHGILCSSGVEPSSDTTPLSSKAIVPKSIVRSSSSLTAIRGGANNTGVKSNVSTAVQTPVRGGVQNSTVQSTSSAGRMTTSTSLSGVAASASLTGILPSSLSFGLTAHKAAAV